MAQVEAIRTEVDIALCRSALYEALALFPLGSKTVNQIDEPLNHGRFLRLFAWR